MMLHLLELSFLILIQRLQTFKLLLLNQYQKHSSKIALSFCVFQFVLSKTSFSKQINFTSKIQIINSFITFITAIIFVNKPMASIIKQLDASRRLEEELAIQKHRQQLQRLKIDRELQGLRRSRKEYIDSQLQSAQKDYQKRLRQIPDIAEQHFQRQKRAQKEKSKVAQGDFQKARQRLLEERNNHDALDKEYRALDKSLLDLQARSKYANEQEQRRLKDLQNRRKLVTKLLDESKKRELEHFDKAKAILVK